VYPTKCLAGKLGGPARLNAVAARQLAHMLDLSSGRRFLVDTGSSFSILPFSSSSPATGPSLTGPAGEASLAGARPHSPSTLAASSSSGLS
jgi:hypothetical protein